MKIINMFFLINCFFVVAINAQNAIPTDTVLLFITQEEFLENRENDRMLGKKHLQITNYAGNTILLRLNSDTDGRDKKEVLIHSPEKKVFLCPNNIDSVFVTINPGISQPACRIIKRNGKYELFYNKSERLYDIKLED